MPRLRGEPADADDEFQELARSAGADVVGRLGAALERPQARFYVGSGKADELAEQVAALDAELVLVDALLSPVQERNLEAHCRCMVVDRARLILDIFAQRARSHEGKLEVELAQLRHMSTRLVRGWTHLERQRGGSIGLRGPGETQLELDRRLVSQRIKTLTERLRTVLRQRETGRRARQASALPQVALVGYTNAGKSTLFNALTQAAVYADDRLFATLDPTVRRIDAWAFGSLTVADTVGFIRNLPHDLVAAFKSTLTEAREADLLLHVVDAADPHALRRRAEVDAVLEEIGAGTLPQIVVMNKIDRLGIGPSRDTEGRWPRVWVSAQSGLGLPELKRAIEEHFGAERLSTEFELPHAAAPLRARLLALGVVREEASSAEGWRLRVDLPRHLALQLAGLPGPSGQIVREHLLRPAAGVHGEPTSGC